MFHMFHILENFGIIFVILFDFYPTYGYNKYTTKPAMTTTENNRSVDAR